MNLFFNNSILVLETFYRLKTKLLLKFKNEIEQHLTNVSVKPIDIKEEYLYEPRPAEEIWILIHFIRFECPLFLVFLLRTWLKKGFKNKVEWYDYILNLI